ncbi:hypothetical protein OG417_48555 [Actinoallomurus sp. NBC_01490]|jgi:hypothetical protein|uniref:hypothetical protein n=1 Tax=Actinoallomurus sp. NBC_01490 TaxID=2903557 RepID=UPI002E312E75|nr:hypothetical protein [Actinoallomurus sp. NBC_01490]
MSEAYASTVNISFVVRGGLLIRQIHHGAANLLLAAIGFWLPVLGERHRLSDPGRTVYLFLAAPALDLPGVWVITHRHAAGASP